MKPNAVVFFALGVLAGAPACVSAQDRYPSKPIQMLVAYSTGTTTDILARTFAEKLGPRLGQTVTVQNRPGAGGTIAGQAVASAAPDGYTILSVNSSHAINPSLYTRLPYDSVRDFAGIALVAETPYLVVVNPLSGARTLKEFIALAKQKPGTINYATAGLGTSTHLAGALFATLAGIELVHVPYKTTPDLVTDLLSNRVQATFVPPAFLLGQIREGKLLALGVSTAQPLHTPFEVPSVRVATNLPYEYAAWFGFMAPAKTPTTIMETLSRAFLQIAEDKDVQEKYRSLGLAMRTLALRDFEAYVREDMTKLGPLVKASGAKAD